MAFSLTENLPFLALPLALMMLKVGSPEPSNQVTTIGGDLEHANNHSVRHSHRRRRATKRLDVTFLKNFYRGIVIALLYVELRVIGARNS